MEEFFIVNLHADLLLQSEELMRKELEKQDRERRKEEERMLREQQRREEKYQREEKRQIERREKFMQRELLKVCVDSAIQILFGLLTLHH